MGLSSSKHNGAASSSSPASSSSVITRRTRSYTSRLLNHSCLRSYPQVSDGPTPRTSVHGQCANKTVPKEETYESCGRVNDEHELRGQVRTGCMPFEVRKPSTNFLSRFNCLSGNVNFMMKRTNDFGSSKPYMLPESLNNEFEPSTSASQPTRSLDEELVTHNSRKGKSKKSVRVGAGVECDENLVFESRIPGEIIESNARFSRTLSVGRLRDRGLISRVPFPDINSSQQQGRDSSNEAGPSSSVHGTRNNIAELQQVQYHHPQEYRSTFLERRRRIRSQVRALQRIGSQFGNISGHELTCILSGQHQRGHCTCNITLADQNNKTSSGANVSRIVMLAEALFEVLDEIQQQSLALSSRPALSSIGSVPAPPDVVELLPVRSCREMQDNFQDDATQCYICLIEYEQGDSLRILPCHHNFHKACIDKWLKEIHRVCPLCRGDVCKTDKLRVADM